jgi:hypothetical protein
LWYNSCYLFCVKTDDLVKSRNSIEFVIPAKAGIHLFQDVLDPGACPGHDPGFAGVTLQETFYEIIKTDCGETFRQILNNKIDGSGAK